jgi:hypothetical protein
MTGTDPPTNLHARIVPLKIAINDMKYSMESGSITNNVTNLSSKHRETVFRGPAKAEVWDYLRKFATNNPSEETTAVEDGDDGAGQPGIDAHLW